LESVLAIVISSWFLWGLLDNYYLNILRTIYYFEGMIALSLKNALIYQN